MYKLPKEQDQIDAKNNGKIGLEEKKEILNKSFFWIDPNSGLKSRFVLPIYMDEENEYLNVREIHSGNVFKVLPCEILEVNDFISFLSKKDIGSNEDWDKLFYHRGLNSHEVASFHKDENYIEIVCHGEQTSYYNGEKFNKDPELLMKYKDSDELTFGDECWLDILIFNKDKELLYSSYENTGTVYSSIKEALNNIKNLLKNCSL